jgi:hypothetical protein
MVPPITASIAVLPIISLALLDLPEVAEPSLLLGGYTLKVWRYKNVGGIGVNIFKNGKRKFGVDFHGFDATCCDVGNCVTHSVGNNHLRK